MQARRHATTFRGVRWYVLESLGNQSETVFLGWLRSKKRKPLQQPQQRIGDCLV